MTNISEINKGDRVRANSEINDDTAEFTVAHTYTWGVESATNSYVAEDFTFEVIKPAPKPVPTEPGIYSFCEEDTEVTSLRRLMLTNKGDWYYLDFTGSTPPSILGPVQNIQGIVNNPSYAITPVYTGKK